MTITEFLLARVDEDERRAGEAASETQGPEWDAIEEDHEGISVHSFYVDATSTSHRTALTAHIARHDPARILAECKSKRVIIEFHKQWPVLVEGPTKFDSDASEGLDKISVKMSRQIMWATEQEYRNRFGDEPPTTPIMRALASVYSDHPDYQQEWAL